jgi:hypothetical protein
MQSLEQILRSDSADSDFASLEPRMQQLLFSRLRTENARLQEVEWKWSRLTESCPRTDIHIYLGFPAIEPSSEEDGQNGYSQEAASLDQWSYPIRDSDENENDGGERRGLGVIRNTSWGPINLVSESPDSDLRLCFHRFTGSTRCPCLLKLNPDKHFSHRVSSQLLLYRLTVTFGMPPPKGGDGYKSCWAVDLQHCDGASVLSFKDYKGAAVVRFYGTTKASAEALKLLNFLVGESCRHTYDGIAAGAIA